jgi:hypothetical protein
MHVNKNSLVEVADYSTAQIQKPATEYDPKPVPPTYHPRNLSP